MHSEFLEVAPELATLGLSTAVVLAKGIDNQSTEPALIAYRRKTAEELAKMWRGQSITSHPKIAAYHTLHERFGVTREAASPEKLLSYIRRNQDLTGTGAVIDCYNLASVRTLISIGAHDLQKLELPVSLRICGGRDRFTPLDGSEPRSCTGEYGYIDERGRIICRLDVLQGQETAVDTSSTNIVFFLQGNPAIPDMDLLRGAWYLVELLETFCGGSAGLVAFGSTRATTEAASC